MKCMFANHKHLALLRLFIFVFSLFVASIMLTVNVLADQSNHEDNGRFIEWDRTQDKFGFTQSDCTQIAYISSDYITGHSEYTFTAKPSDQYIAVEYKGSGEHRSTFYLKDCDPGYGHSYISKDIGSDTGNGGVYVLKITSERTLKVYIENSSSSQSYYIWAKVYVLNHTHTWGNWSTVTDSTCTATGTKKRTCSTCGATETGTIDKKNHNYNYTYAKPTISWSGTDPNYTAKVTQSIQSKCSSCSANQSGYPKNDPNNASATIKEKQLTLPDYTRRSGNIVKNSDTGTEGLRRYIAEFSAYPTQTSWGPARSKTTYNGSTDGNWRKDVTIGGLTAKTNKTSIGAKYSTSPFTVKFTSTMPDGITKVAETYKWYYKKPDGITKVALTEGKDGWTGTNTATLSFQPTSYKDEYNKVYCEVVTTIKDNYLNTGVNSTKYPNKKLNAIYTQDITVWASDAQTSFRAENSKPLGRLYFGVNSAGEDPKKKGSTVTTATGANAAEFIKAESISWEYSTDNGVNWTPIEGSDKFEGEGDITVTIPDIVPGPNGNVITINNGIGPTGTNLSVKAIHPTVTVKANDLKLCKTWLRATVGNNNSTEAEYARVEIPIRFNMETFYDWVQVKDPNRAPGVPEVRNVTQIKISGNKSFVSGDAPNADTQGHIFRDGLIKLDGKAIGYSALKEYNYPSIDVVDSIWCDKD